MRLNASGEVMGDLDSAGYPAICRYEAQTWVYPTNYEVREYQRIITETALFHNTLVCLPTGLGKTLIAAVVLHAYYKWFERGIVVFLAPTKPLVEQQVKACHNIMGIPARDTAHLEGSVPPEKRATLWHNHRVFFCTPQTMANDLKKNMLDPRRVVCVVFDEAHKATKSFAYTIIMEELVEARARFRVLALSATPGSETRKIQEVIDNLRITRIEVRSEDDPDVGRYRQERNIEYVMCDDVGPSGQEWINQELLQMLGPPAAKLAAKRLLNTAKAENMNFFAVDYATDMIRQHEQGGELSSREADEMRGVVGELRGLLDCRQRLRDAGSDGLLALMQQVHARVTGQGSRSSSSSSSSSSSMSATSASDAALQQLSSRPRFSKLLESLKRTQNDTRVLEKHRPKIRKLQSILSEYFRQHEANERRHSRPTMQEIMSPKAKASSTRVIVFANLRSTVGEIVSELRDTEGVRASEFIGQSSKAATSDAEAVKGQNQRQQAEVLQRFNAGVFNVLVATSIAEEGLDIAEVDVIVLFDAVGSPIRLVQRMGRTGRKRAGRVIILTTKGSGDQDKSDRAEALSMKIRDALRNPGKYFTLCKTQYSPRMIPDDLQLPAMLQQNVEVEDFHFSQVAGAAHHKKSKEKSEPEPPKPLEAYWLPQQQQQQQQHRHQHQPNQTQYKQQQHRQEGWDRDGDRDRDYADASRQQPFLQHQQQQQQQQYQHQQQLQSYGQDQASAPRFPLTSASHAPAKASTAECDLCAKRFPLPSPAAAGASLTCPSCTLFLQTAVEPPASSDKAAPMEVVDLSLSPPRELYEGHGGDDNYNPWADGGFGAEMEVGGGGDAGLGAAAEGAPRQAHSSTPLLPPAYLALRAAMQRKPSPPPPRVWPGRRGGSGLVELAWCRGVLTAYSAAAEGGVGQDEEAVAAEGGGVDGKAKSPAVPQDGYKENSRNTPLPLSQVRSLPLARPQAPGLSARPALTAAQQSQHCLGSRHDGRITISTATCIAPSSPASTINGGFPSAVKARAFLPANLSQSSDEGSDDSEGAYGADDETLPGDRSGAGDVDASVLALAPPLERPFLPLNLSQSSDEGSDDGDAEGAGEGRCCGEGNEMDTDEPPASAASLASAGSAPPPRPLAAVASALSSGTFTRPFLPANLSQSSDEGEGSQLEATQDRAPPALALASSADAPEDRYGHTQASSGDADYGFGDYLHDDNLSCGYDYQPDSDSQEAAADAATKAQERKSQSGVVESQFTQYRQPAPTALPPSSSSSSSGMQPAPKIARRFGVSFGNKAQLTLVSSGRDSKPAAVWGSSSVASGKAPMPRAPGLVLMKKPVSGSSSSSSSSRENGDQKPPPRGTANATNAATSTATRVPSKSTAGSSTTAAIVALPEAAYAEDCEPHCLICLSVTAAPGDPLVFCDGPCGGAVHASCYGLTDAPAARATQASPGGTPTLQLPDKFYCAGCEASEVRGIRPRPRCALCGVKPGPLGLLYRSADGQYCHPVCAKWIPEIPMAQSRPTDVRVMNKDRYLLRCITCDGLENAVGQPPAPPAAVDGAKARGHKRSDKGPAGRSDKKYAAIIQCHYGQCYDSYHPFCAMRAGCLLLSLLPEKEDNSSQWDELSYHLYCRRHEARIGPKVQAKIHSCLPDYDAVLQRHSGHTAASQTPGVRKPPAAAPLMSDGLADTQDEGTTGRKRRARRGHGEGRGQRKHRRLRRLASKDGHDEEANDGDEDAEDEDLRGKEAAREQRRQQWHKDKKRLERKFLDAEAAVSGSGSQSSDEDSDGLEGELSGDFINGASNSPILAVRYPPHHSTLILSPPSNSPLRPLSLSLSLSLSLPVSLHIEDGAYTPNADLHSPEDELAMYFALNRDKDRREGAFMSSGDSPRGGGRGAARGAPRGRTDRPGSRESQVKLRFQFRGGENGLPLVERLLAGGRASESRSGSGSGSDGYGDSGSGSESDGQESGAERPRLQQAGPPRPLAPTVAVVQSLPPPPPPPPPPSKRMLMPTPQPGAMPPPARPRPKMPRPSSRPKEREMAVDVAVGAVGAVGGAAGAKKICELEMDDEW